MQRAFSTGVAIGAVILFTNLYFINHMFLLSEMLAPAKY